jgi:hypothetical protein
MTTRLTTENTPHEGLSIAEVARQAGHSVEECARTYVHVFEEFDPGDRTPAERAIEAARNSEDGHRPMWNTHTTTILGGSANKRPGRQRFAGLTDKLQPRRGARASLLGVPLAVPARRGTHISHVHVGGVSRSSRLADPLAQSDDDAFRPTDVGEPIRVLVLHHFAYELGPVGAHARDDSVDVFDGEHDATDA